MKETVGERIQTKRKEAGLTVHRLGILADLGEGTLKQIETDQNLPSLVSLCKITKALRIGIDEIVPEWMWRA